MLWAIQLNHLFLLILLLFGVCRWVTLPPATARLAARAALHWHRTALARPYGSWVSFCTHARAAADARAEGVLLSTQSRQMRLSRVLARLRMSISSRAFSSWCHSASAGRRARQLERRVLGRMQHASLCDCLDAWTLLWRRCRHVATAATTRKALMRLRANALVTSFERWHGETARRRREGELDVADELVLGADVLVEDLGSGRIVASETEAPNTLANPV